MPELEFLADMNISPLTVDRLKKLGCNVIRVSDVMDRKSKDIEILTYALEHDKVVITQDLDFSMALAVSGYKKPSVILRYNFNDSTCYKIGLDILKT